MMDDEDLGPISLNLDTSTTFSYRKGKEKIHGDRRSRIKQRRNARHSETWTRIEETETISRKRKLIEGHGDEDQSKPPVEKRFARVPRPDGIISSLFKKNPEIPVVESATVESVSEDVFTGRTFKDLPIHPFLVSNLEEKQGFTEMTQIQQQAIPVLLKGKDALIKSQTGSGKTLAYAVPIVQAMQSYRIKVKRVDGPYALIIVPTRELAIQSYDIFVKLLRTFVWIVPGCLMGGEKRKAEKSRLRKGVNILITTPGRLLDHIQSTNVLSLSKVNWLIIDEADRLLELGYGRDIAQIINTLRVQSPDPQTVLLSATLSAGVERLSSITLHNPEHISCNDSVSQNEGTVSSDIPSSKDLTHGNTELQNFSVPSELEQFFLITPCKLRLVVLAGWILWKCKYTNPRSKMIVFMSTQDAVEFHSRLLLSVFSREKKAKTMEDLLQYGEDDVGYSDEEEGGQGHESDRLNFFQLHGDMKQKERTETFHKFAEATSGVLLCTDVAARGLDLPLVDWIVQYTLPGNMVDYIHRIGRTARAGTKGNSLLFLMPSEVDYVQELNKRKLCLSQIAVSKILNNILANVDDLPQPERVRSSRQMPRTEEEAATFLQDRFEEAILRNKELHSIAAKGFQSYVRAYGTYSKEVKEILKVSNLHLGHVAKSFALREAPSKVHGLSDKTSTKWKKERTKQSSKPLSFKQAALSEFSSGLQSGSTGVTRSQGTKKMHFKKNKTKRKV